MSETIRSFIAVELDSSIREELSRIQNQLRKSGADVKGRPFGSPLARGMEPRASTASNHGLKPVASDAVKWVSVPNMHLTLKFLGHVPTETMEKVRQILAQALKDIPSFEIEIDHLGAFPSTQRPRVVWAGIHKNADKLKNIANIIDEKLLTLGFEKEDREFSAHLTLGRVRSSQRLRELAKGIEGFGALEPMPQTVRAVTLFKSTLTPSGPIYSVLQEYPLASNNPR